MPGAPTTPRASLEDWYLLARQAAHLIRHDAGSLTVVAANAPDVMACAPPARRRLARGSRPWLELVNRPAKRPPLLAVCGGHWDAVEGCGFAGDGSRLVSVGRDGRVYVWETSSGRLMHEERMSPRGWLHALGPGGSTLWAARLLQDETLELQDPDTGRRVATIGEIVLDDRDRRLFLPELDPPLRGRLGRLVRPISLHDFGQRGTALRLEPGDGDPLVAVGVFAGGAPLEAAIRQGAALRLADLAPPPVRTLALSPAVVPHRNPASAHWAPLAASLAVEASGERAAFLTLADRLTVYDMRTGAPAAPPVALPRPMTAVAFAGSGTVVTAASDGSVWLVDLEAGSIRALREDGPAAVTVVAGSRDGARIAVGHEDGRLEVCDPERPDAAITLAGHEGPVSAAAFAADGRRLVTGSADGSVWCWDVDDSRGRPLGEHQTPVTAVACAADGRLAASATRSGDLRLWNPAYAEDPPVRHRGPVTELGFSPRGGGIVSTAGEDGWRVWDGRTGAPVSAIARAGEAGACRWIDERSLFTMGDYQWALRDAASGAAAHTDWAPPAHALSPDGRWLFAAGSRSGVVYDVATGARARMTRGPGSDVRCCAVALDRQGLPAILAWGTEAGQVEVESIGRRRILRLDVGRRRVRECAFAAEGALLLARTDDVVRTWRLRQGWTGLSASPWLDLPQCFGFALDPAGEWLALSSREALRIVPLGDGPEPRPVPVREAPGRFGFAGRPQVLWLAWRSRTEVWDPAAGVRLLTVRAPHEAVAVSADGRRAVAVADDRLTVFDLATGSPVARCPVDAMAGAVAWSPDRTRVALGTLAGRVLLYRVAGESAAEPAV